VTRRASTAPLSTRPGEPAPVGGLPGGGDPFVEVRDVDQLIDDAIDALRRRDPGRPVSAADVLRKISLEISGPVAESKVRAALDRRAT
jgi:hypothetical protein